MTTSALELIRARYEEAIRKLAVVLELDFAEVVGMFGGVEEAMSRASKIVGFFESPEINAALQDVIRIAQEHREAAASAF